MSDDLFGTVIGIVCAHDRARGLSVPSVRQVAEQATDESRLDDNLVAMDAALTRMEQRVGNEQLRRQIMEHQKGGSE